MRVFQHPTTGDYHREDGAPGYACALCGNGYATAATRDDTTVHACEGFNLDLATLTGSKGIFDNGHTAHSVALLGAMSTVEFACVWEYRDAHGFGGHSDLIGRNIAPDGSTGPWLLLSDAFWLYLHDSTNPVTLEDIDTFLDPTAPVTPASLDDYPVHRGANVAHFDRTH